MNSRIFFSVSLFLFLALSISFYGCSRKKVTIRYYSLTNESLDELHMNGTELPPLLVDSVKVNSLLEQGPLVQQQTSYSLSLVEHHQWAGNLTENLTDLLMQTLMLKTGNKKIFPFPNFDPKGSIRLIVRIIHFEQDPSGKALVEARWKLIENDTATIINNETSLYRINPDGTTYDDLVRGLGKGFNQLCNDIATALRQNYAERLSESVILSELFIVPEGSDTTKIKN